MDMKKSIEKRTHPNGTRVKCHVIESHEMVRMVGITSKGTAVVADKQLKKIVLRDPIHGGSIDLSHLLFQ